MSENQPVADLGRKFCSVFDAISTLLKIAFQKKNQVVRKTWRPQRCNYNCYTGNYCISGPCGTHTWLCSEILTWYHTPFQTLWMTIWILETRLFEPWLALLYLLSTEVIHCISSLRIWNENLTVELCSAIFHRLISHWRWYGDLEDFTGRADSLQLIKARNELAQASIAIDIIYSD